MSLLYIFVIFFSAYFIMAVALGIYDIGLIVSQGKALQTRKETLESLASIHGYSPSGWNRFKEYNDFIIENGNVILLYEEYIENKWKAITKTIVFSFPLLLILIANPFYSLWISMTTKKKEKA